MDYEEWRNQPDAVSKPVLLDTDVYLILLVFSLDNVSGMELIELGAEELKEIFLQVIQVMKIF